MAQYEFRYVTTNLYQSGGSANPVIAEIPFTGVNFTQQLNSIGSFQGHVLLSGVNSVNQNIYAGTIPGLTVLWVLFSDAELGVTTPVWSGVIWAREYDSASQTLSINAQEMMSVYQKRRIVHNKTYTFQNPAYIANDLMAYAEAKTHGNTGLNIATAAETALSATKTYQAYEFKSIYQAIKDLSQYAFDFKIKPSNATGSLVNKFITGTLNTAAILNASGTGSLISFTTSNAAFAVNQNIKIVDVTPSQYNGNYTVNSIDTSGVNPIVKVAGTATGTFSSSTTGVMFSTDSFGNPYYVPYYASNTAANVLQFPGNVIEYKFPEDASSVSNTLFGLGYGVNSEKLVATAISKTYLTNGSWPIYEDSANYIDVGDIDLLKSITLGQLQATAYPPTTIEVVLSPYVDPVYPQYNIGDEIRLDIKDDLFPNGISFDANNPLRIVGISVNPGETGPARVTLTLTRQITTGSVS